MTRGVGDSQGRGGVRKQGPYLKRTLKYWPFLIL